jgi:hypothetical protein
MLTGWDAQTIWRQMTGPLFAALCKAELRRARIQAGLPADDEPPPPVIGPTMLEQQKKYTSAEEWKKFVDTFGGKIPGMSPTGR